MYTFQNVTRPQWVNKSFWKGPVCANFTDTHRRQFYWIYNGYFHLKFKHVIVYKSYISFKGFADDKSWRLCLDFFSKINCPVSRHHYARLWITFPIAPHSGLRVPHAPCSRHWQPGKRKWTQLLLTCPTPSRRTVVNLGQSKCTDWYLWFNVYMVFSSTKVADIGQ